MADSNTTLTELPRDVLRMLRVELRNAEEAEADIDLVEMLQETIARIERLETALGIIAGELPAFDNLLGNADLARIALHGQ